MEYIHNYLKKLFKKNDNYIGKDGDLLISKIAEDSRLHNSQLIKFLLNDKRCRDYFFEKIDDITIFKSEDFRMCINDARFLGNSFTKYGNKIGLITDRAAEKIMNEDYAVLSYPYKDCTLDGGMTKTEAKRINRKETMINNILFKEDIHKLKSHKAFKNFRKYSFENEKLKEEIPTAIKGNENIIINGNNFAALCSLKAKFAGKIKLIYIDPPYNTGNDTFSYNDNFNHSTWLVFMKDRLQLARELLSDDGAIFVQCDDNEQAYLKVLMDEIFGRDNFINSISILSSTPSGIKTTYRDRTIIKTKDYILVYAKKVENITLKPQYTKKMRWDTHYNKIFDRETMTYRNLVEVMIENGILDKNNTIEDISVSNKKHRAFYLKNADCIFRTSATMPYEQKKISKKNPNKIIQYTDTNNNEQFALNGNRMSFLNKSLKEVFIGANLKNDIANLLCDFWFDIDFNNTQNQGGISFISAKKPEQLLYRIIDMTTNENDIVLDFFAGSGTALAVAHKMNRQYIGVEQIQEHFDICIERLKKVIEGESGGISKNVDWRGGGY